jgi:putative PIN family toxin of toxin-antitoxin system
MTAPPIVVDTNVVVAGLVTSDPDAPTRAILDAMLAGRFRFLLSEELLSEYREVLFRPSIRSAHGLDSSDIDEILVRLVAEAVVVEVEVESPGTRDDFHLTRLLEENPRAVLITGDRAARSRAGQRGLTPRQLVERFPASG